MRGGVECLFLMVGAIGAAETLDGDDFMDLLAWVCFLSAVASLALLQLSPSVVYDDAGGYFHGAFSQKNVLGRAMAFGALACLHRFRAGRRSRLLTIVMLLTVTFVCVKSQSMASLTAIVVLVVLNWGILFWRRGGAYRVLAIALIVLLVPIELVAFFDKDQVFVAFGKDPTLTGRTMLWQDLLPDIFQRPLLGWGYRAFFSVLNGEVWRIAGMRRWFPMQAHNGLLQLPLDVGLVGTVLILWMWGRTVRISLQCMRGREREIGVTSLLTCVAVVVIGVAETVLLYPDASTIVFITMGLFCEKALSAERIARATVPMPVTPGVRARAGLYALAHRKTFSEV